MPSRRGYLPLASLRIEHKLLVPIVLASRLTRLTSTLATQTAAGCRHARGQAWPGAGTGAGSISAEAGLGMRNETASASTVMTRPSQMPPA